MDWYTWLSKSNLDPSLINQYGTVFSHNELQYDDVPHFTHDFLQSIGISIAKHRLEILKLAKKYQQQKNNNNKSPSKLNSAIKKLFTKFLFHKYPGRVSVADPPPPPYRSYKTAPGNGRSIVQSGPLDRKKVMLTSRSVSVSGPLDHGRMHERLTYLNCSPIIKRPMSGSTNERLDYFCKSPTISGAIDKWGLSPQVNYYKSEKLGEDEYEIQSLWSMMFQDMKPT